MCIDLVLVSQQCIFHIFGQGKLVEVLVQLTLWKINTEISVILDNQIENGQTTKTIFPNFTQVGPWLGYLSSMKMRNL